ncbi:FtsX-like permease family protein [Curtobacterium sp. RRHDQ10]|uniref:FtsX-like permease family protein n=1 Tax=Curtobacterium phyllosphaerae TaxID=3413379 RepID=UPI003BF3D2EB
MSGRHQDPEQSLSEPGQSLSEPGQSLIEPGRPAMTWGAPAAIRFVRRSLGAQWSALVAFAVLVAVVTAAGAAAPRLTAMLLDQDLRHTIASASPAYRDLTSSIESAVDPYSDTPYALLQQTWRHMPTTLATVRHDLRPGLRSIVDGGHFAGIASGYARAGTPEPAGFDASGVPGGIAEHTEYRVQANPELRSDARLVRGHWPQPSRTIGTDDVLQVVATAATARTMGWRLDERQTFSGALVGDFRVELVGVVRPVDPHGDLWVIDANRASPSVTHSKDGTPTMHGTVFIDADSWPDLAPQLGTTTISTWLGIDPDRFSVGTLPAFRSDLTAMLADPATVGATSGDDRVVRFQTFLPQTLDLYAARATASAAVLAVSATGPLGVAAVTVLLGTRGLLHRRRAVRELMRRRGASAVGLGWAAARDVAVASVPAALVGALAAVWLVPADTGTWIVATVLGAAGPPVLAWCTAALGALDRSADRRTTLLRRRWVPEALALVLAAGAVTVVIQRALVAHSAALESTSSVSATAAATDAVGHVDVLVTATPLLLAAAAAVLLLRLRPHVARWSVGLVRRRGAAAFVGTAEDVRGGSGAAWVLATIVGATSIGVLAGTVLRSAAAADLPTDGRTRGLDTAALVGGLAAVIVAGLLLSAVMTAASITLTVVAAAPGRRRRGAMLRTLGLTARQRTAVTLWELVPRVVLGIVAGILLGVLGALVLVPAVVPPAAVRGANSLVLDPGAVLATAGLFTLAAVIATITAVISDRRRSGVLDERSDA